jgi:hypothetical protein
MWGQEALIGLYSKSSTQAETFKDALTLITLGIDSSDRCLGSLWVVLSSLAALKSKALPKILNFFGIAIGVLSFSLGLIMPVNDSSASFLFGIGAIVWWIALGLYMLKKQQIELKPSI